MDPALDQQGAGLGRQTSCECGRTRDRVAHLPDCALILAHLRHYHADRGDGAAVHSFPGRATGDWRMETTRSVEDGVTTRSVGTRSRWFLWRSSGERRSGTTRSVEDGITTQSVGTRSRWFLRRSGGPGVSPPGFIPAALQAAVGARRCRVPGVAPRSPGVAPRRSRCGGVGFPGLHLGVPGLHLGVPGLHLGDPGLHLGDPGLHPGLHSRGPSGRRRAGDRLA